MQILLSRVEAQGSSICRVMAIAACVVIVCAGAVLAQSIAGQYRVEGRNPDGSVYDGSVRIADNDGAIAMTWSVESHSYQGTGTRNQDVIWVDWGDRRGEGGAGPSGGLGGIGGSSGSRCGLT